jgi:ubiquitin carboxyl-terminal hydrolase 8
MSSVARAGPPPSRPDPKNKGEPASAPRTLNGVLPGDIYSSRSANRVFPHIDDLVAARPDVNVYTPIRRLLLQGESHSKQAETHIDFRRPDIGLEEYIKAFTIVVEIIPRHKDYPELKSDRGDLHRLYTGLQKRISSQEEKFEEVKKIIKENNARSGVKPALRSDASVNSIPRESVETSRTSPISTHDRSTANDFPESSEIAQSDESNRRSNRIPTSHLSSTHDTNTLLTRQRPPVQPKPEALHGRAINHPPSRSSELASVLPKDDLLSRFARLRASEPHSGRVQDPRIRTHPIEMPDTADSLAKKPSSPLLSTPGGTPQARPDRPSGPRDMPKVPSGPLRPLPIDVQIPSMPRPPDAVYSPARSLNSPTNIDMPQSASRTLGVTGRSSSGTLANSILRTSNSSDDRHNDYYSPIRKPFDVSADSKPSRPYIKNSTTVTAEELMEYLKRGSHELPILLVDIRERENFDSGHIMSHSIICIEPIVLRSEMSAEELSQSLVLSPETEQKAFDKRETFELVIYYDQSSSSIPSSSFAGHGDEVALRHFSKAVYDYGYEKQLKRRPILLVGGLDSWTDLVGSGALQASQTATTKSNGTFAMGKKAYESRPLSADEERWNQALGGEDEDESESFSFVRTTEEFFRRFPEPSAIQESMISPPNEPDSQMNRIQQADIPVTPISVSKQEKIDWALPQIPARPAPALPRQSYSGISGRSGLSAAIDQQSAYSVVDSISERPVPPRPCGLTNGSNFCYMNATIQALRATGPFREFFIGGGLLKLGPPPRKGAETTDPPQLMAKNFANILEQLSSGQKLRLEPKRFRVRKAS